MNFLWIVHFCVQREIALVVYMIKRKTILDCTSHTWFGFITRLPWIITRRQTTKFHNTTNAITLSVETIQMEYVVVIS